MKLSASLSPILTLIVLTFGFLPMADAAQNPQSQTPHQANKKHPNAPDLQILEIQSLGRAGADPKGDLGPEMMRIKVKNWTDRLVTGILWEISVYDAETQKVVEVLTPYTSRDSVAPDVSLKIAPGYLIEVPFYLTRTVHCAGTHTAQIKIKNYAYRKYDPESDKKPSNIAYLTVEEWPFKSNEPVATDEKH